MELPSGKRDSGATLEYFSAREVEVMHRGFCILIYFADACDFSASFFEKR